MARAPRAKSKGSGYKKKGPSKTELETDKIFGDMMEFWKAIGDSKVGKWQKPWVYNFLGAENAGKFILESKRTIYQGNFNQFMIASYMRNREPSDLGKLMITRGDVYKLLGAEDDKTFPLAGTGIDSVGTLFKAPTYPKYWLKPDGRLWKHPDRKNPTKEEVRSEKLEQKTSGKPYFGKFIVWSAEDLYDLLSEKQQEKLNELVELRSKKGHEVDPSDNITNYIANWIDELAEQQGVKITYEGNKAFYAPGLDVIQMPKLEQFGNPVAFAATALHELAHSTMAVTNRNPNISNRIEYAMEEIVAETASVMMIKHLEEELKDVLSERPDVRAMFVDFYDNAMSYQLTWGEKFNFKELVSEIDELDEKEKSTAMRNIMVNTANAVDTVLNKEFSPDMRIERIRGMEKPDDKYEQEKDREVESPGMQM